VSPHVSQLVCAGCGTRLHPAEPYPFRCPSARRSDDVDHVLRRELDLTAVSFPVDDPEPNPFLRYRRLLHAYHLGLSDGEFCELVRGLDQQVAAIEGRGFATTPFARSDELSDRLGFTAEGGVWVKDETGNVSGSHKARHLFGVLIHLKAVERLGLADRSRRRELAVASCGNAALAAALVAAAERWPLRVFVSADADPVVATRLGELGARVTVCPRDGQAGDPPYRRLLESLEDGALPFTCQGNLNGLAVEGGFTLGYELAAADVGLDRLLVQVGGGALASACSQSLQEAVALGALSAVPRMDTVQTTAASPLKRAFDAVRSRGPGALSYAAQHRSGFMWPWEGEPRSIAHGILDDETYDWLAVVKGMLATGGQPVVVGDMMLADANAVGRESTGIDVDSTGSAGLAGLIALCESGEVADDERVGVLFTGVERTPKPRRRTGQ
jgi:threonine synthase